MKNAKRMIALVLALVLAVSVFTACGENKENKEEEKAAITATAVKFSKDGKYTTTVKSDKIDLSDISAKNVEVSYEVVSDVPSDVLTVEDLKTAVSDGNKDNKNNQDTKTVKLKVDSVKNNPDGGYDISFIDNEAAENQIQSYTVNFKKPEATVSVAVDFPEITVTPDIKLVNSSDKEFKVTLALKGSEYIEKIDQKDITLGDAFEKLNINSISASGTNLTMQLSGSLKKNEVGLYQWGTIGVKPSGINDAYQTVTAKVEVKTDGAYIDNSTLKYDGGKITAELKVYGAADVNKLKKDDLKIDGAIVESLEKKDDNTALVTLSADKIESLNDFADKIGGKKMTVGDYKTEAAVYQASFYPVFDYIEEDGNNFKLTLKLYADNGTFDKALKTDAVSFGKGFENAKLESVKLEEDNVAALILSVPAKGQKTDNFSINGEVTLAKGALTNIWGDKTSREASFTRKYSNESLGKDVTLNADTLLEIQKYTRGLNTVFGSICYYGSAAGSVYSLAKSILEATGVLESDHVKVMKELKAIKQSIEDVKDEVLKVKAMLRVSEKNEIQIKLSPYEEKISRLNQYIKDMTSVYEISAVKMALEDAVKTKKLDKMPDFAEFSEGELDAKIKEYGDKYLPKTSDMTDKQAAEYNERLVDYMLSKGTDVLDTQYDDFKDLASKLNEVVGLILADLSKPEDENPMTYYNQLCALSYNFDSQSYEYRLSQRVLAESQLARAIILLSSYYKITTDPTNTKFRNRRNEFQTTMKYLDKFPVTGHSAKDIKANPRYAAKKNSIIHEIKVDRPVISEFAIAGLPPKKSASAVEKLLTDNGYTVCNQLLNMGTNGYKVYLGYKTTKNYDEAVKGVIVLKDTDTNTYTTTDERKIEYKLASYIGDTEFEKGKGNINEGTNAENLHIYYTKQASDLNEGKVIDKISARVNTPYNVGAKSAVLNVGETFGRDCKAVNINSSGTPIYLGQTLQPANGTYKYEEDLQDYIKDIMLSGVEGSPEKAKSLLTDRGYTVINQDLNAGAGGHYIYLGYKTTKNINESIKELMVFETIDMPKDFMLYKLCPYIGDSEFVKRGGDLNENAGGMNIYLYYNRNARGDGYGLTDIYFNSTKSGSVDRMDLNNLAGGDYIYMHAVYGNGVYKTNEYVDEDPEYYPFCYFLNHKVSYGNSEDYWNFTFLKAALQGTDGNDRDWTSEEVNEFCRRMHSSNARAELESAGIRTNKCGVLTKATVTADSKYFNLIWYPFIRMNGNVIQANKKYETKYEDQYNYINKFELNKEKTMYDSCKRNAEFVFFKLHG